MTTRFRRASKLLFVAVASVFADATVKKYESVLAGQSIVGALTQAQQLARFLFHPSVVESIGMYGQNYARALVMSAQRFASYLALRTAIFYSFSALPRNLGARFHPISVLSVIKQVHQSLSHLSEMSLALALTSASRQWTLQSETASLFSVIRAAEQNVRLVFQPCTIRVLGTALQKYALELPEGVGLLVEKYAVVVAKSSAVNDLILTAKQYASLFSNFKMSKWLPYFFVMSTCCKVFILSL